MGFEKMDFNNDLLHTPDGMRDTYGKEMAKKSDIMNRIRNRIRLYGYEEIQTPTIEFYDVFSSEVGTKPVRELYKLLDNEGNLLVLRPDFTPSVARCAAKYFYDEASPIRFTYAGSVFGNTSSLQGKLSETIQMGAELINAPSVCATISRASARRSGLTSRLRRSCGTDSRVKIISLRRSFCAVRVLTGRPGTCS